MATGMCTTAGHTCGSKRRWKGGDPEGPTQEAAATRIPRMKLSKVKNLRKGLEGAVSKKQKKQGTIKMMNWTKWHLVHQKYYKK